MPEAALPDAEITTYFLDTFVAVAEEYDHLTAILADRLGMYLLDLMELNGHRVVSGVSYVFPEPEGPVPYPEGFTVLRASVNVQEMDATI